MSDNFPGNWSHWYKTISQSVSVIVYKEVLPKQIMSFQHTVLVIRKCCQSKLCHFSTQSSWDVDKSMWIIDSRVSTTNIWVLSAELCMTLQWRHNDHDGVSNHQPHGCLLKRLFRRRSKKTSKLCVTGLCVGNSPGPVNSPHKRPVTRKVVQFDDVIMNIIQIHFEWCRIASKCGLYSRTARMHLDSKQEC